MANYSDISGYKVKYLSSDPTLSTSNEGQVWYNSTEGKLKSLVQIKAWSSGGNMNTAGNGQGSAGTQTSALSFLGSGGPTNNSESYNGSTWTATSPLNTSRYIADGCGSSNDSALAFGGFIYPPGASQSATESWDGSSWTTVASLNTARHGIAGAGTQTSALAFGGVSGFPTQVPQSATESWNGTSWTSVTSLPSARSGIAGIGSTNTAVLAVGGAPGSLDTVDSWDGSSWTSSPAINTGRNSASGFGIQASAVVAGGNTPTNPPSSTTTEFWDGSSWINNVSLPSGRNSSGAAGTSSSGAVFGGDNSAALSSTVEYNSNINAITPAAWASGGTYSQTAQLRASFGTQTAGALSGGYIGANSQTRDTEEYNGTSWTVGGALSPQGNPDGGTYAGMATGTQTAGLFGGGSSQGGVDYYFNTTQEYDGSTWASPATFPSTGRILGGMFGTQTAGVLVGGERTGTWYSDVDKYNGTAWTSGTAIPTAIGYATSSGTETAGLFYGGDTSPSSTNVATTFAYDGSAWTAGGTMNLARDTLGGSNAGTQTASIAFGGNTGTPTGATESYDGSVWSSDANMATARSSFRQGSGTAAAALAGGGLPSACEEFTGGTSIATASTLTTS